MLKSVKITNIALIEDVEINFNPGVNILSGETGAGKSIILNSLNLISGEQAKLDLIRNGENKARIKAIFDICDYPELQNFLEENIGEYSHENILIIEREIDSQKGSTAFLNHNRVLVQTLKKIGSFLIDIHGQHLNQSLFDKNNHLKLLDKYCHLDNELKSYQNEFQQAINLNKILHEKIKLEEEKEKFFQFSNFALDEINRAELNPEEEGELDNELSRLLHFQEIKESFESAFSILYKSDNSAHSQLQQAQELLEKNKDKENEIKKILPFLGDAIIKLEPVIDFLQSYKDDIDFSPTRLNEVNLRLEQIKGIKKKYGNTIEEVLEYRDKLQNELEQIEQNQGEIEKLEQQIDDIRKKLGEMAIGISKARKHGAKKLEQAIENELSFLGMDKARFQVNFEHLEDPDGKIELDNGKRVKLSKTGIEKVEFLISSNLGESFKPLAKTASGGEISRIMLSIKNILRKIDPIATLIFDEVDAGIGGETAFAVGKKIKEISEDKQVICITHLPQIASMGSYHYKVKKIVEDGRTKTLIQPLNEEERVQEISRMLSGEQLSDISIEHAKQFLEQNAK